jgi:hypothetical protein
MIKHLPAGEDTIVLSPGKYKESINLKAEINLSGKVR